jgi:hypothetical protein
MGGCGFDKSDVVRKYLSKCEGVSVALERHQGCQDAAYVHRVLSAVRLYNNPCQG